MLRSLLMRQVAAFVPLAFTISAHAGQEVGTVQFENGQYGSNASTAGLTFFYLAGTGKSGTPGCAAGHGGGERWVISNDWPAAKLQIGVLLAAFVSGKQVRVIGSSDCAVWGDSETAIDIVLVD